MIKEGECANIHPSVSCLSFPLARKTGDFRKSSGLLRMQGVRRMRRRIHLIMRMGQG